MARRAYRQRIYPRYLEAGAAVPAAEKLAELQRRAPYLERLIREHFPADRTTAILDLGCGAGAMEYFARRQGFDNIMGVDRSPQQVAAARSLGLTGVREGDLLATLESLAGESQGLVIAFDVLEHFGKDELLTLVDQVARVLKSGGKFLFHVPNGESPFVGRVRYADFTHELAFTRESLAQLLNACGFAQIYCYEDQPAPHGILSGGRWLMWKIIRGLLRLYLAVETGNIDAGMIFSQNLLGVAVK
ncbi:MAG: class I SAM-dependent methyltransferase [Deltaproteobacteria bacterium]|nr:class I SAM-dependent methyltransferase [Deltaproteobacteria bacterium]